MKLSIYQISEEASLGTALEAIERNGQGVILTINENQIVSGLATDGDIRRRLIQGATLDSCIATCTRSDFARGKLDTPRELLLKKLDQRIRVLPLIDEEGRLVGIVNRNDMPVLSERTNYARSRSPVRISFSGGGSDVTDYFSNERGAVLNATISLASHATLKIRDDSQIVIHSLDIGGSISSDGLVGILEQDNKFSLIQAVLEVIKPDFGFELWLHSDFSVGSGLGGSAAVAASIIGCFNVFRNDQWNSFEMAELAFHAERIQLGVSGGWQDQYATVFGGFNFVEFNMEENNIHPLRLQPKTIFELEESLILCDTKSRHDSGKLHDQHRKAIEKKESRDRVTANVELAFHMRDHLLHGRLTEFGMALHEAWQLKRNVSKHIASPELDKIYNGAMNHGAIGGKLLGAGGGGYFLFFVPPFCRHQLINHIDSIGLKSTPFRFDESGLVAWKVRDEEKKPDN